jgi:hypothetical protein
LINPLQDALIKAAQELPLADRKNRERLFEERNAFAKDRLNVPTSPEVRALALKYVEQRLELERRFVKDLSDLKATMPKDVSWGDQDNLEKALVAAQEGVRRMEAVPLELAAAPDPRTPPPTGPSTSVSSGTKDKPLPRDTLPKTSGVGNERPEQEFLSPPPKDWKVTIDPPHEAPKIPEKLPYQAIDCTDPAKMIIPPGLTRALAAAIGRGRIQIIAIYDLTTGKLAGQLNVNGLDIRAEPISVKRPMLSPDGNYFAFHDFMKKAILIGTAKNQRGGGFLKCDCLEVALLFPTPNHLLAVPTFTDDRSPAQLWALPAGTLEQSFPVVANPSTGPGQIVCSPGGRYLAIAAEGSTYHTVHFYDLTTGKLAGSLNTPGEARTVKPNFSAIAFSPDGTEFAGYVLRLPNRDSLARATMNNAMACWDIKTGRLVYLKNLEPSRDNSWHSNWIMTPVCPEPLQWFPDGKGWLLYQRHVIDRQKAAVVENVPVEGTPEANFANKILDDRRVLVYFSSGKLKTVEVGRSGMRVKSP